MFTREDTKAMKGVAIILMLFHHLATYPSRYPFGFDGFVSIWKAFAENGYLQRIADHGSICVSFFFFLGGYGLYKRWESGKFSLSQSIISLYKQYWKVFIIFIPIAFCFFARSGDNINSLATRYVIVSKTDFISALISNFIGYTCSFNSEWWFFSTYLCVLPLGCLLIMAMKENQSFLKDMFIVIIINIFICNIFPNLTNTVIFANINSNVFYRSLFLISVYACPFFEGIVFAKYDAIAAMKKKIESVPLKYILCVLGIAAVFWCRIFIEGSVPADIVYIPFLIAFISTLVDGVHAVQKAFSYLGEHSTNMWYVHSFYCYYFLEITKIVYITKNVWIDLLILIAMSLATSALLEFIYGKLGKLVSSYVHAAADSNT